MGHPLDGVEAKIDRGFEHIVELETEIAAFLSTEAYSTVIEPDNSGAGWHLVSFRIDHDPPIRFGIIAGEVMGQFRSSLDHLTVQLIRAHKPGKSRRHPNFPIYSERAQFGCPPCERADAPYAILKGVMRPAHLAMLEQLQPYHLPRSRYSKMLLAVQRFTNLDKHDLVHPAYMGAQSAGVSRDPNISGFDWIFHPGYRLGDQTKLYRVRFVDQSQVYMPMRIEFTVAMGASGIWLDTRIMRYYGRLIRALIRYFRMTTPEFRLPDPVQPVTR